MPFTSQVFASIAEDTRSRRRNRRQWRHPVWTMFFIPFIEFLNSLWIRFDPVDERREWWNGHKEILQGEPGQGWARGLGQGDEKNVLLIRGTTLNDPLWELLQIRQQNENICWFSCRFSPAFFHFFCGLTGLIVCCCSAAPTFRRATGERSFLPHLACLPKIARSFELPNWFITHTTWYIIIHYITDTYDNCSYSLTLSFTPPSFLFSPCRVIPPYLILRRHTRTLSRKLFLRTRWQVIKKGNSRTMTETGWNSLKGWKSSPMRFIVIGFTTLHLL